MVVTFSRCTIEPAFSERAVGRSSHIDPTDATKRNLLTCFSRIDPGAFQIEHSRPGERCCEADLAVGGCDRASACLSCNRVDRIVLVDAGREFDVERPVGTSDSTTCPW